MSPPSRPWIAYVGPFHYPDGGAAARRVLGMAESLDLAGFNVVIASGAGDVADAAPEMIAHGPGISHCLLGERVAEHWPRPLRRFRYAWMGGRTVQWLASRPIPPAAVVLYSGYTPYLQRLLPWCRTSGIPLLFDAVEWYEPEHPWQYLTSPYQWNIEWAMRRLIPKTEGVIAISRYLADYYLGRNMPVAVVPPTTSLIAPGEWQPGSRLRLCYAGTPGYKDDLATVLRAVAMLAANGAPIHLTVAGPDRSLLQKMLGEHASGDLSWLHPAGSLSHREVMQLVGRSDFSVLARRPCRMSQAGFPTKFVESFASGTPVVANLTSDLHLHLRNGETGLLCAGHDVGSIMDALQRALALDEASRRAMRAACIQHAHSVFAPAVHAPALRDLIATVGQAAERRGSNREHVR